MIFDIDNWKEIGATLARNKTRTFLTAFGIFWGTAMLTLLMGGGSGLRGMLSANFAGLASNSAVCYPHATTMPYKGYAKGLYWSLTQTDVENIRRCVPQFEVVSPIANNSSTAKYGRHTFSASMQGIEPNYMNVLNPIVKEGRFINDADIANDKKVCVIGVKAAQQLFGGESPIGKQIECDNVFYTVVGVAKQRSMISFGGSLDESLLIPLSTMRRTYNMGDRIHFLALIAKPGESPTALFPSLFRAVRISHPLHPNDKNSLIFQDISAELEKVDQLFGGVDFLLLFVGLSSLIAGIIGVGNIMWIIVKERTQEFGIRRAIGATPKSIMTQILAESAILTSIAGIAGICFAVGVLQIATTAVGASMQDLDPSAINFQVSFDNALWIMAVFLILGSAAGAIPAIKAMRIKPIEAINDK